MVSPATGFVSTTTRARATPVCRRHPPSPSSPVHCPCISRTTSTPVPRQTIGLRLTPGTTTSTVQPEPRCASRIVFPQYVTPWTTHGPGSVLLPARQPCRCHWPPCGLGLTMYPSEEHAVMTVRFLHLPCTCVSMQVRRNGKFVGLTMCPLRSCRPPNHERAMPTHCLSLSTSTTRTPLCGVRCANVTNKTTAMG